MTGLLFNLFYFLIAIIIIVFVHEMGHFLVARWCGVKVSDFSIGFGPKLVSRKDKHGTDWKICAIPLGGYVKFAGDANAASLPDGKQVEVSADPNHFVNKAVWQKALVVAAGPLANFLFAIVVLASLLSFWGEYVMPPRIDEIEPGSAAEAAGLKPGDIVRSIDGEVLESYAELQKLIFTGGGAPVTAVIERAGTPFEIKITPQIKEIEDILGGKVPVGRLGIRHISNKDTVSHVVYGPVQALGVAVERTWEIVDITMRYAGRLLLGRDSSKQIGGIGSMAATAGNAAEQGVGDFIGFLALVSVSIGLINLFPIPMLDGGHLMFYGIEALRGKPLGPVAQEWSLRIGVTIVAMLLFLGNFNDIIKVMTRG